MSDVLSNYFKTYYNEKNTFNITENVLTPNKKIRIKKDVTARNLSPYGIYLSENNTLLFSSNKNIKNIPPLSSNKNKYSGKNIKDKNKKKIDKNLLELNLKYNNDKINLNSYRPQLKKCFSERKNNELLLDKKIDLKKDDRLQNIKSNTNIKYLNINKNDNINEYNKKSRNKYLDFSLNNYPSGVSNYIPTSTSVFSSSRRENKTYFKTFKKEKDGKIHYKNTKKEKIENKLEAQKIINELLSLKTKKDIKSYYIKKDYSKAVAEATITENNHYNKNNTINPKEYIKMNFKISPNNNNLFRSYDTQLMIMGNQKYRNDLLERVNIYKNNYVQYEDLKGPIGFDKNKINEKKRNEIIKKMENDYSKGRGLIFSKRLYKRKNIKKNDYEFDEKYKDMKKLLYKNLDKYESHFKFEDGKRVIIKVDKNDINILKKINNDAEFLIKDKDEMIKYTHRFLSFDDKINKLLSKMKNTTNFLSQRAEEHNRITKKIDQLYYNFN